MPSEQFERKLRARMEQARVQPRPELWDAIAQQVAEQTPSRKGGFWLWIDGVLGVLLVLAFLIPVRFGTIEQALPSAELLAQSETSAEAPAVSSLSPQPNQQTFSQADQPTSFTTAPVSLAGSAAKSLNQEPSLPATSSLVGTSQRPSGLGDSRSTPVSSLSSISELTEEEKRVSSLNISHPPSLTRSSHSFSQLPSTNILLASAFDRPVLPAGSLASKEIAPLRRWTWKLAAMGQFAPGTTGLNPFAQSDGPDLLTNYRRGLGGNQQIIEDIYAVSFPRTGFTGRIGLAYQLTSRISIESGVGLSHIGQGQYKVGILGAERPVGPTSPEQNIVYEDPYSFAQTQIELPLLLNFALHRGENSWIFSPGIAFNHQLQWKVRQTSTEVLLNEERSILNPAGTLVLGQRKWYPHLQGKLLYQRALTPGTALFAGPVFQYQLGGSYAGAQSVGQVRYRVGVEVGILLGR